MSYKGVGLSSVYEYIERMFKDEGKNTTFILNGVHTINMKQCHINSNGLDFTIYYEMFDLEVIIYDILVQSFD